MLTSNQKTCIYSIKNWITAIKLIMAIFWANFAAKLLKFVFSYYTLASSKTKMFSKFEKFNVIYNVSILSFSNSIFIYVACLAYWKNKCDVLTTIIQTWYSNIIIFEFIYLLVTLIFAAAVFSYYAKIQLTKTWVADQL